MDIMKKSKVANVVIKLDMTKTYDRVDWTFLVGVLTKMGFDGLFIDKI